jgi:mono/diheme cytochrome c family protein
MSAAAAIGFSAAVAFSASAGAETRNEIVAKGRALLEANCSRCHAIGKDDVSKHPEALPFREVVKRYPPDNLAEALAEGINSGHPDMPEFVFQPPEIEAIVTYLGTLAPARATAK